MTDEEQRRFDLLARQYSTVTEQLNACGASLRYTQEKLDQAVRTNTVLLEFIRDKGIELPRDFLAKK